MDESVLAQGGASGRWCCCARSRSSTSSTLVVEGVLPEGVAAVTVIDDAGGLVLGEPTLQELDAWRLLLNIADGYPGMSFGDGGALAIVAPAADLAAGRLDRLVAEPSMS